MAVFWIQPRRGLLENRYGASHRGFESHSLRHRLREHCRLGSTNA